MIKSPRDFDGALKGFTEVVEKVKQAKSMPEVSALERQGRSAMREVQISAGYIGYRLKEVVDEARARINKELWEGIHNPQPVKKPVEKPVEKSEMEFHPEQYGGTVTLEYKGTVPTKETTAKKTTKKKASKKKAAKKEK